MKLFRTFRQGLLKERKLRRYLIYAVGEILLVMIGILLAFQVNNWNDDRVKKKSELIYYQNIRDQIANDKELIQGEMGYNLRHLAQFNYANSIIESNDRSKLDTLGKIVRNLTNYSDFDREGNTYETMVNSGEIKLLRNPAIVNGVRELEESYNYINRMENIHYDAMMNHVVSAINPVLKYTNLQIKDPEAVYSYEFQNMIIILMQVMEEKNQTYEETIAEIDELLNMINTEIGRN